MDILTDFHEISMRYPCGFTYIHTSVTYPRWISCLNILFGYISHIWISKYVKMSWISLDIYGYHWIYVLNIIGYMCLDKSLDILGYVDRISMDIWNRFLDCRRPLPLWGVLGGLSDINTRHWKFDYPLGCQCRRSACLKRHFLVSNGQL